MEKKNLIVVGSSGHAKVIIDIFEKQGTHQILGLLDDYRQVNEESLGYKIIGGLKDLNKVIKKYQPFEMFVAVGDNWARSKVVKLIKSIAPDMVFPTGIHPSAQIGKGVRVGKGVAIMANVVVNSDSDIGDFTYLNTKSSADHDTILESYASIGPNVTLGGNVTIKKYTAILIGATTKEKLLIGEHSIVGAGALLMSNCPDKVVMYGVPARVIRAREIGEKYV